VWIPDSSLTTTKGGRVQVQFGYRFWPNASDTNFAVIVK